MWRERLRDRWPLAVAIGVGCAGPTMITQLARPLSDTATWVLVAVFFVVWVLVTAWIGVRVQNRERRRAHAQRAARTRSEQ